MNPKLTKHLTEALLGLAREDVQVFLATHDYMLTSDLSLAVDTHPDLRGKTAFFSLHRPCAENGVVVERGEVMAEIQENPILDAFADLHDREREAFRRNGDPR